MYLIDCQLFKSISNIILTHHYILITHVLHILVIFLFSIDHDIINICIDQVCHTNPAKYCLTALQLYFNHVLSYFSNYPSSSSVQWQLLNKLLSYFCLFTMVLTFINSICISQLLL